MRQVVLDTETTGLEVEQQHRIIEIGCVELINRRLTGRSFHRYLNPERDIDEGALQVHGLTPRAAREGADVRARFMPSSWSSSAMRNSSFTTRRSTSLS